MNKIIPIGQLKAGMYVVKVTKQAGKINIKNQGLVKSANAVSYLKKSGILEVEIDLEKSLLPEQSAKPSKTNDTPAVQTPDNTPQNTSKHSASKQAGSASFEGELNKANRLYNEAKQIQQKAFNDIQAGKDIDVGAFQDLAHGFMDSVFRNQDALSCLTRLREKDAYLMEHSINVSILMSIFAKHLNLDKALIHEMATGALLHDLGKIKIPDAILHKPARLTEDEFAVMKTHSLHSQEILQQAGVKGIALEIAALHHERLDGKGYPYGKKQEQLGQHVRMASIVDVYDALTAERVYKKGMTPIRAFKILKAGCPDSFDNTLLTKFIQCIGIHPVGTLVKLTNNKVGIVEKSNPNQPLKPIVKTFYNVKHERYTPIENIDLTKARANEQLEDAVSPSDLNVDLMGFYKNSVL